MAKIDIVTHKTKIIFKISAACLFIIVANLMLTNAVEADNGPHGGYTATTDACAGCHRTHTAASGRLLIQDTPNLCFSCHGPAGLGADTNVVDGIYLERDGNTETPAEGVVNRGLKGGGFTNVQMDTDEDGVIGSTAVTSSHEGNKTTVWGNGAIDPVFNPGTNLSISCENCHNPHGGGNYRILRDIPYGSGASGPVAVTDETQKNYTINDPQGNYFGEYYATINPELTDWCSQCHTRHNAPAGSGSNSSGDAIYEFRHPTDYVPCLQCHVAHGTAATMSTIAGISVKYPDGASATTNNEHSSLLRLDDRRVCYSCHVNSSGYVDSSGCVTCHSQPMGIRRTIVGATADFNRTSHHVNGIVQNDDCIVCHDTSAHKGGTVQLLNVDSGSSSNYTGGAALEPYCLACHDANGAGGFPPFSDNVNPPVINQTSWAAAAHASTYTCDTCHNNGHGSNKTNMLDPWNATASATVPGDPMLEEEGFCYRCHGAAGPAVVDIQAQFVRPTHHNVSAADVGGEFLECTNCHNPHLANAANKLADPDNTAVAWTGAQEAFCITCHDGGAPTGVTFPATANGTGYDKSTFVGSRHDVMVNGTDSCRACHDQHGSPNRSTLLANYDIAARGPSNDKSISFTIQNGDTVAVTIDTMRVNWDLGGGAGVKEIRINDVRLWQEPPWGLSGALLDIAPNETMNSGALRTVEVRFDQVIDPNASGWVEFNTAGGQTCYVTFGSGVAPAPGNPCLLTATGAPTVGLYTNYTTDYAMCWQCHNANDVLFVDNVFGEHQKHVIKEGASCIMCHDAHAPHQGGEAGLISFEFAINNGYNISYVAGNTGTAAYQPGSCYINCHGKLHDPKTY